MTKILLANKPRFEAPSPSMHSRPYKTVTANLIESENVKNFTMKNPQTKTPNGKIPSHEANFGPKAEDGYYQESLEAIERMKKEYDRLLAVEKAKNKSLQGKDFEFYWFVCR